MAKKLCELCGVNPATVPDRERMGRLINRVCSRCHSARLRGDMALILRLHDEKMERLKTPNVELTGADRRPG